jgi:hypothetical protein
MQLRRSDLARLAGLGNDLAALNGVAALHQHFTGVGISSDVAVRVPNQNQVAVALDLIAGIADDAVLGRPHWRAFLGPRAEPAAPPALPPALPPPRLYSRYLPFKV